MAFVKLENRGDIAVLTIDYPPVNALGHGVRSDLMSHLLTAQIDTNVRAVVIVGAGRSFIAGADIRELGKALAEPRLFQIQDLIESFRKPVVAAIHGTALGGGLELALTCHARVAAANARLGLPEVKLGILPGAGGTQRLPRLIGPQIALDAILSARQIGAEEAEKIGLVDVLAEGDLLDSAISLARRLADKAERPLVRNRNDKIAGIGADFFEKARKEASRKSRGQIAPVCVIDCIEAACTLEFDAGIAFERQKLSECMNSPQRAALVHLFFSERVAGKIPGLEAKPKEITKAAVIGAGTMGGGIAMCFANVGVPVTLLEMSEDALSRGRSLIEKNYATSVSRGSMSSEAAGNALALIGGTCDYAGIADADIVIEAVFEDMDIKKQVFSKLDSVMKPGAILASNTSTLNLDAIAAATTRPGSVVGTHFFSPANVMRLLENVRGAHSDPEAVATVMEMGKKLGKVTILAGNCDGFIANRMQAPFGRQVDRALESGALPEQIDRVLYEFGFAMGPLAVRDLIGIDVSWRIRRQREKYNPAAYVPSVIGDKLYELGRYGQKTGSGFYRYEGRTSFPDPAVIAVIDEIMKSRGHSRRAVPDSEILERCLLALVNEGAKILDEGIALRASDIDLAYVYGYGFPSHRGGPMHWAEHALGLPKAYERACHYAEQDGGAWTVSRRLEQAAKAGSFAG